MVLGPFGNGCLFKGGVRPGDVPFFIRELPSSVGLQSNMNWDPHTSESRPHAIGGRHEVAVETRLTHSPAFPIHGEMLEQSSTLRHLPGSVLGAPKEVAPWPMRMYPKVPSPHSITALQLPGEPVAHNHWLL